MNQVKCYKLVFHTVDNTLVSLIADALPPGWAVQYVIGQPTHPHTRELFAFDTEHSARTYKRFLSPPVELYEALAEAPVTPIHSVCPLWALLSQFYAFWNPSSPPPNTVPAPPGTITTRSLTLIKRLS